MYLLFVYQKVHDILHFMTSLHSGAIVRRVTVEIASEAKIVEFSLSLTGGVIESVDGAHHHAINFNM